MIAPHFDTSLSVAEDTLGEVPMRFIAMVIACVVCAACAGRDAAPVATVQPHDQISDCAMISAEIEANNAKVRELADEKGMKVAQNVTAGIVGVVVWPVLFAMDAKGAADQDLAALQARQQFLTNLAVQRCGQHKPGPMARVQ
jgi:hypothetical protein